MNEKKMIKKIFIMFFFFFLEFLYFVNSLIIRQNLIMLFITTQFNY
jgi:hypothetical protein